MIDFNNPYNITKATIGTIQDGMLNYLLGRGKLIIHFKDDEGFERFKTKIIPELESTFKGIFKIPTQEPSSSANADSNERSYIYKMSLKVNIENDFKVFKKAFDAGKIERNRFKGRLGYDKSLYGPYKLIKFLNQKCQFNFMPAFECFRKTSDISLMSALMNMIFILNPIYFFPELRLLVNPLTSVMLMLLSPIVISLNMFRQLFKISSNDEYLNKTDAEIGALNDTQRQSFNIGVQASECYLTQFKSCFQSASLMHPKAYYAGLVAGQAKGTLEEALIEKFKPKT